MSDGFYHVNGTGFVHPPATPTPPDFSAAVQDARQALDGAAQFDDAYATVTVETLKDFLALRERLAQVERERDEARRYAATKSAEWRSECLASDELRAELATLREDAELMRWLFDEMGGGFVHDEERYGMSNSAWGEWPDDWRDALRKARAARASEGRRDG